MPTGRSHWTPIGGGWKKEMAIYNLKAKLIKATVIAILITTINQTDSYGAGRTTNSIANTVLSGTSVPTKSLGINGDFYIDTKSMNMYGPKKNNSWPLPISMRGPAGPVGPNGMDGKNGASVTSGSGSTGPAGPAGATGATGAQGPKGDTGTAGTSNIYFGAVTFSNLINGTVGSSTVSSQFGNFLAGKAYAVDVLIYATNSDVPPYSLKVSFAANAGSPVITTRYIVSDGYSYRSGSSKPEYSILAKVIIDGTSVTSNFGLLATVSCGESTSTNSSKLTVNGDYVAQLVGSIN